MGAWLKKAENLLSRSTDHARTLAALQADALDYPDADRAQDAASHPKAGELAELREKLDTLPREIGKLESELSALEEKERLSKREKRRQEQLEDEVTSLRAQLESSNARTSELETTNETLASRDGGQRSEIDRLKVENTEMRASKRWPEWITGASVLAAGMLLGAILHRNATRRPASRIRL